jgi:hypothetical protein
MSIITWLRLGMKLKKLRRLVMSEVGDANQAKLAAERENSKLPVGVIAVIPATAPSISAGISTVSAGSAGTIATIIAWILGRLFPDMTTADLMVVGSGMAVALTYVLAWIRHTYTNNTAPGIGV